VVRERSAKPFTRVRFPSSPPHLEREAGLSGRLVGSASNAGSNGVVEPGGRDFFGGMTGRRITHANNSGLGRSTGGGIQHADAQLLDRVLWLAPLRSAVSRVEEDDDERGQDQKDDHDGEQAGHFGPPLLALDTRARLLRPPSGTGCHFGPPVRGSNSCPVVRPSAKVNARDVPRWLRDRRLAPPAAY
jgi:hypothetical protein